MLKPTRRRMDHEPPEWVGPEADYFITVCAETRGENQFCREHPGRVILDSIRYRNEREIWFCHLAVLMPDHIHLLLNFPPEVTSFASVVRGWKHWLAHQNGVRWQENFFDHRVRGGENWGEKMDYIWQNPVRAGLVASAEEWPWSFRG